MLFGELSLAVCLRCLLPVICWLLFVVLDSRLWSMLVVCLLLVACGSLFVVCVRAVVVVCCLLSGMRSSFYVFLFFDVCGCALCATCCLLCGLCCLLFFLSVLVACWLLTAARSVLRVVNCSLCVVWCVFEVWSALCVVCCLLSCAVVCCSLRVHVCLLVVVSFALFAGICFLSV